MAECAASVEVRNPFAIDLFNYIWNKFNYAIGDIPNTAKSNFETGIGDAVVCLMVMTRECLYRVLRNVCIKTQTDAVNITLKLCKARRHFREHNITDNFQLFLELCAIIAEVHLYCCAGKGCSFDDMVFISWDLIMKPKFMQKIMTEGGWVAMYSYASYYQKTINFINENFGPFEYPYDEFTSVADIGEGFYQVIESYVLTFKNWRTDFTSWHEGYQWLREREKIKKRIARLEAKASSEKGALAQTQSQIATQKKKLRCLESSGWTEDKMKKYLEPVSPYRTSEEEEAAATTEMKTSTKKKRKSKKKKKRVKQVVAPSPPPSAVVAPSPPPSAVVAPSPPPSAVVAPSPPPSAVVAPSPPRAKNQSSKKSRKKNK